MDKVFRSNIGQVNADTHMKSVACFEIFIEHPYCKNMTELIKHLAKQAACCKNFEVIQGLFI